MGAEASKGTTSGLGGDGLGSGGGRAPSGAVPEELVERIRALKLSVPLLKPSAERIMSEAGVPWRNAKLPVVDGAGLKLDPTSTLALLAEYERWLAETSAQVGNKQEGIHSKIDATEALAFKVLRQLEEASASMRTAAKEMEEVHSLQVECANMRTKMKAVTTSLGDLLNRLESTERSQSSLPSSALERHES
eukprot:TRINITY_DN5523_c0_g2_i5.p1 TRINITY_DN5523_c0_g2~~TRINITY_DN5523_c0_g2_i5.p1  ORF type:complete len:192 (+),score=37.46 TRINITY_DN5523_c0_g2_i5:374-949(+)